MRTRNAPAAERFTVEDNDAKTPRFAARTEQHFCPIRHDRRLRQPHSRYPHFLRYGDALGYRKRVEDVSRAYGDLHVKP